MTAPNGGTYSGFGSFGNGVASPPYTSIAPVRQGAPAVRFNNSVNVFAQATNGSWNQKFSDTSGDNMSVWVTQGTPSPPNLPIPPVPLWSDTVALTFGDSIKIFTIAGGALYQIYSIGSEWSSWFNQSAPVGVTLSGNPAVVQFRNSVNVFARGWDSRTGTNKLYQKVSTDLNGNDMGAWVTNIPIPPMDLTSSPVAVSFNNSINVFALGFGEYFLQIYIDGGTWSNWTNVGKPSASFLVGNPAAVLFSNSSINVFFRSNDGAVRQIWSTNSPPWWSNWQNLGVGPLAYDPAVVLFGTSINVLGVAFDGTFQQQSSLDAYPWWSGWQTQGGNLSGNVAIVAYQGSIKVFAAGNGDGTLQQTWSLPAAPWWKPWQTHNPPPGTTIASYTSTR